MVKPHAGIFTYTLEQLSTDASEAIFIDDNEKHTEAAKALGIHTIHFLSAGQLKDELIEQELTI
jgi:HAD superfamily hydrolase (TIGR01509 family)